MNDLTTSTPAAFTAERIREIIDELHGCRWPAIVPRGGHQRQNRLVC